MARILTSITHDLGGLLVNRILPNPAKRMVGPFIFFDKMGPSEFPAGEGINVRPHPHIGLSTLSYLFEGSMLHRDSLGNHIEIFPGDVNWMTAGKGIVHSERETFEVRAKQHALYGLQSWIALPQHLAELEPSFSHVKKHQLPEYIYEGVMMRLIVGEAFDLISPVKTYSPMFYLDVLAKQQSVITKPNPHHETAIFLVSGAISINAEQYTADQFVLLDDGDQDIVVEQSCRLIMLGGERFDQVPHIDWNFVSFNNERIEQAKQDWRDGCFPRIPGDDREFISL